MFDADGRLVEIQAVGRDVTERREAETGAAGERGAVPADRGERAAADRDHRDRPLLRPVRQRQGTRGVRARGGRHRPGARSRASGSIPRRAPRSRGASSSEGSAEQAEVRMRRADGSEFDAIMSARPLNYGGEPAVLGVITDITERRRIEEALRESEARLAALMDNAPLVVHLKDRAGRYLLANPEIGQDLRPRPRPR